MKKPFFSVVIPTYKRRALLELAIDSVRGQTYSDWELVVSDDEDPPGETWNYVARLPLEDSRIRIVRNTGPHGQAPNTNNSMRYASGEWIKPLHDDDRLTRNCLELFHSYLKDDRSTKDTVLACCRTHLMQDGRIVHHWKKPATMPPAEIIPRRFHVLAMYRQEDVGSGVPSALCIRRDTLIEERLWMEAHSKLSSSVDVLWTSRIGAKGDRLIINEPLVLKQNEQVSVTGTITDEALDAETKICRESQFDLIDPELNPPSLRVSCQAILLNRAAHSLVKRKNVVRAIQLAFRAWHPGAWWEFCRFTLIRHFPKSLKAAKMPFSGPSTNSNENYR